MFQLSVLFLDMEKKWSKFENYAISIAITHPRLPRQVSVTNLYQNFFKT